MHSLLFFGSVAPYSNTVLSKLHQHFQITGVITTPPKPQGRSLATKPSSIALLAHELGLPSFTPNTLDTDTFSAITSQLATPPDFIVVSGFGKLIPPEFLAYPKIAALNLHPSLLPQFRGPCPAQWTILLNAPKTGVTIIQMDTKFDTGQIYSSQELDILPTDTQSSLYQRLFSAGADLLIKAIPQIASGQLTPQPQVSPSTHARFLSREDGFIPWEFLTSIIYSDPTTHASLPALVQEIISLTRESNISAILNRMVLALSPWPGVWTTQPNGKRLKLLSANNDHSQFKPLLVQEEGGKPKTWDTLR